MSNDLTFSQTIHPKLDLINNLASTTWLKCVTFSYSLLELKTTHQGFKKWCATAKTAVTKRQSEGADTDTIIHSFYDKEQIVINSHHDDNNYYHNTYTDRNCKSL